MKRAVSCQDAEAGVELLELEAVGRRRQLAVLDRRVQRLGRPSELQDRSLGSD